MSPTHGLRACISPSLALLLVAASPCAHAQFSKTPGFGSAFTRKEVSLKRKLPPVVNMAGKSIGLTVEGQGAVRTELQTAVEGLLTRESNVQVGGDRTAYKITCNVTSYNAPRVETTKDKYNNTTNTYLGALVVAFRIAETGSGQVVRSGTASLQIDQQGNAQTNAIALHIPGFRPSAQPAPSGYKINSALDVENVLVAEVARQIASYVVPTDETVPILLATGGPLSDTDKLATTGLWSRNLEQLETMTPLADPRLDAYRLYNIGVANEALAYEAQDRKSAITYLQEASTEYGKAFAARGDEKFFLEPQNRIRTALAHYDDSRAAAAASTVAAAPPPPTPPASAAPESLTNADVLAMVQAHMDQANILDNIQTAPHVSFDLSVDGQVKLLHGGVNNQLLAAMKQKARSSSASNTH